MVTVRTAAEAAAAGLKVPTWVPRDTYLLGHDAEDGALMVWGPEHDRAEVERLATAYA